MAQRVLFVLNRVDDESGGTLTAGLNLASALSGYGVQVTLTSPVGPGTSTISFDAADQLIERIGFRSSSWNSRFGGSSRHAFWLLRNVRRYDSVHIHSAFHLAAVYTAILCWVLRVPFVVWPHGSLDRYDTQKHRVIKGVIGPLVVRPMLGAARAVMCTTARELDDLVTYGARPRTVEVPLPVSARPTTATNAQTKAWREARRLADSAYVVLFLGRITEKKGLPRLVEAISHLRDIDAVLLVAGAGDPALESEVVRLASELGVRDRLHMLGWVYGEELDAVLSTANVFALASDNENFGLAVVEALLAGLPVVISDEVYLAGELSAVGAARVVGRSPDDVGRALRALHDDPQMAASMAYRGAEFARSTYSPAAIAARLLAELGTVIPVSSGGGPLR